MTVPAAKPQPGGSAPTFTTKPAGAGSVTTMPVAVDGPTLATCSVYESGMPATTGSGASDLVMLTSACVATVVVAVALLLPGTGSRSVVETVAVFESEPRVAGPTVTGTTIGVEPPAAMFASVHVIVVVPLHPAGNAPAVTPAGNVIDDGHAVRG